MAVAIERRETCCAVARSTSSEDGTVLILVAVSAVVLFTFVSLALWMSVFSTSGSQLQGAADSLAERGLMIYQEEIAGGATPAAAAGTALTNLTTFGTQLGLLGTYGRAISSAGSIQSGSQGTTGEASFGAFYWSEPAAPNDCATAGPSPDDCPCDGSSTFAGPCFANTGPTSNVNSLRMDLYQRQGNSLPVMFGQLIGQGPMPIQRVSVAAITPLNVVALVDGSRSVADESHFPVVSATSPSQVREPVFVLDTSATQCPASGQPVALAVPQCMSPAVGCSNLPPNYPYSQNVCCHFRDFNTTGNPPYWTGMYWYESTPLNSPGPARDEYACYITNLGGTNILHSFADMTGWQPQWDIFASIHQLLLDIESRDEASDSAALNYFADFYFNSGNSKRLLRAPSSIAPEFDELKRLTDVSGAVTSPAYLLRMKERMEGYLFPDGNAGTNFPLALRVGFNQISEHPFAANALNEVFLFTDGLATCSYTAGAFNQLKNNNALLASVTCNNNYNVHLQSLQQAETIVRDLMAPNNIHVNAFVIGKNSGAHTILRTNADKSDCLTQADAVALSVPWTQPDPAGQRATLYQNNGLPGQPPYFSAASFIERNIVRPSEGTFGAIRPTPTSTMLTSYGLTLADCRNGLLYQQIVKPACTAASQSPLQVVNLPPLTTTTGGRLLYDPFCRTNSEQISDLIDFILQQSPITLVPPEPVQ